MMGTSTARRVALVGGGAGAGACSVALSLAAALMQQGQDVLLLDERSSPQRVPPARGGQLVLVNAVPGSDGALSSLAAGADHIVVVCAARSDAITQTYLCIKKLHHFHALANLRVLVNEVADPARAGCLFTNLAATGSHYLGLTIRLAGFVRTDPFVAQARQLNLSVVQTFKASAAAQDFLLIASDLVAWPCEAAAGQDPRLMAGHALQLHAGAH